MISMNLALCLLLLTAVEGFVAPLQGSQRAVSTADVTEYKSSTTMLNERQWNFNEGQGPWGVKKNAEIWNGRVAQVRRLA